MGNYTFPSLDVTYMAPGHNSMFQDSDGKRYLVYHQRFDNGTEDHEPRVHQLFVNADGWYTASRLRDSARIVTRFFTKSSWSVLVMSTDTPPLRSSWPPAANAPTSTVPCGIALVMTVR